MHFKHSIIIMYIIWLCTCTSFMNILYIYGDKHVCVYFIRDTTPYYTVHIPLGNENTALLVSTNIYLQLSIVLYVKLFKCNDSIVNYQLPYVHVFLQAKYILLCM